MTALRPERESGTSYGQEPYGASGAFEEWSVGRQAYQPPAQEASYQPPVEETSYQSGTGQTAYQSGTGQTAYQQPTDDERGQPDLTPLEDRDEALGVVARPPQLSPVLRR